ncbi:MAG: hypothetical protein D6785_01995, partial [Planctomycetota bacterium]
IRFLQDISGFKFHLPPSFKASSVFVNLKITKEDSVANILALILFSRGYTFEVKNKEVFIQKRKSSSLPSFFSQKMSFQFKDASLISVVQFLHVTTKKNIVVLPSIDIGKIRITFKAENIPLKDALDKMLKPHRLTYEWKYGAVVIKEKKP